MSINHYEQAFEESRPLQNEPDEQRHGHCYDAEKCNAQTFCDCPCKRCMATKRGYEVRG